MIHGLKHSDLILQILSDYKPHFSREFVDAGLLEYRRRVTDLRRKGHDIESVDIPTYGGEVRPGYVLKQNIKKDLFAA